MMSSVRIPADICYGSLAFFQSILHNIFLLYHVDIFVSVYKIDKTSFWIGEGIFLIWNSLNDPIFGWISDKDFLGTSSHNPSNKEIVSKRLKALKINGPIFALTFMLFWFPWGYAPLQFVICLCLYDSFLTMIDLHHSALLADLAISAEIRAKLNWKSSFFSALGSLAVFVSYAVWRRENLWTFRMFCLILALSSVVGFYFITNFLQTAFHSSIKQYELTSIQNPEFSVERSNSHKEDRPSFKRFITQLLRQQNFVLFSVMNLVQLVISIVMFCVGPSNVWMLCLFIASNRVFTEGTCKLLNLVISDLVDEDFVVHGRKKAVSALMFGTSALVSKPGQTLAPLVGTWFLSLQTGHDIFETGNELGTLSIDKSKLSPEEFKQHQQGCFNLLVYIPIVCAVVQLLVWTQFSLHGSRLRWIKSLRAGAEHSVI
ncbi:hypothetical protein FSP39_009350 [Pinctada imbricata]|uniref:Transmembrane protein 180 n=1 Tax=Pinctada imbricata TaxID=66713 RepID=A0AA89C0Y5_PINIB|nr:hypothetical protein FSP39_009350 [Pinctada imbricata]